MYKNCINVNQNNVNEGKADLHIHSIHSDGSLTPQEIIKIASHTNLKAISITDHDTIDANESATRYCNQCGIEFIPGVEISAQYGQFEIHLLGYFINIKDQRLNDYLKLFQAEREKRVFKIIDKLYERGMKIDPEVVLSKAQPGSVGRPHIADAMVELGYVNNFQQAFDKYLGDKCSCFVPKYKLTPGEAIELINQAGGLSFIAHPGIDINDEGLVNLISLGLQGIETVHPRHTPSQIGHYKRVIERYNLLECGGSDCHGNRKKKPQIGKLAIPYTMIENMKKRLKNRSTLSH